MIQHLPNYVMNDAWARLRALSFAVDFACEVDERLNRTDGPTDGLIHRLHMAFGAAGLVRPFSWPTWDAPMVTIDMVPNLNTDVASKHITRIVRADRFNEGVFEAATRSGVTTALARHLYELCQTENGWPTDFPLNPDGSVRHGINGVAGKGLLRGVTNGRRYRCADCDGGWSIEVTWRGGRETKLCSKNWHFFPEHDVIHVVSNRPLGEVSKQLVSAFVTK